MAGERKKEYVIAIDLGTSCTAYSWKSLSSGTPDDYMVGVPDKKAGEDVIGKSPTALLVAGVESGRNNFTARYTHSFGRAAEENFASGYGPFGSQLFRRFKMCMYDTPTAPCPPDYLRKLDTQSSSNRRENLGKILVLALRCIKDAALERLLVSRQVSAQDVVWVLTVPVDCSNLVKTFIRHCAAEAGLVNGSHDDKALILCQEPVAACLSLRKNLTMEIHDTYLVVDCGGGTVDIASFRVINADAGELSLVGEPSGLPWGATKVDDAFNGFLEKFILGAAGKQGGTQIEILVPNMTMFRMKKAWESAKINLRGVDDRVYFDLAELCQAPLNLSVAEMDRQRHRTNGHQVLVSGEGTTDLILEPALLQRFFKPCCDKIATAVLKELDRPELGRLTSVVMVGGFSNSVYLKQRITACVEYKHPWKNVSVISPPRPDLAVVGGASHFGSSVWSQTSPAPRDVPRRQLGYAPPPSYREYRHQRNLFRDTVAPVSYGILTSAKGESRATHCDTFITAGQRYTLPKEVRRQYTVVAGGPALRVHIVSTSQRLFEGQHRLNAIGLENGEILEVILPSPCRTSKDKKRFWKKKAKYETVDITVVLTLRGVDLHVRVSVDETDRVFLEKTILFSARC